MNKFKLYLNSQFNTPELKFLEKVSIVITLINIIAIIFGTVASFQKDHHLLFTIIEYSALSLFIVEYLLDMSK